MISPARLIAVSTRIAAVSFALTSASAQVTITGVAATDLEARGPSGKQTLPAGSPLTNHQLSASGPGCYYSQASASVDVALSGTTVTYRTAASAFLCANVASAGGSILLNLSSPTPTAGALRIDDRNGGGMFTVDIGNDGTIEFSGPAVIWFMQAIAIPLVVDAAGVPVLIDARSVTTARGSQATDLTLKFSTQGPVVPEGVPCGADLQATYSAVGLRSLSESFILDVRSSSVTPFAFFVLGTQQNNIAVPPSSCVLRTNIVVALTTTVNLAGKAQWRLNVPWNLGPLDIRAQYIAATGTYTSQLWHTSQAMRLRLP